MRIFLGALTLGFGLVAYGQPSLAQSNDDLEALRRCATIEDEAVRHACYDQVLQPGDGAGSPGGGGLMAPDEGTAPALLAVPGPRMAVETKSEAERAREEFGREVKKKNEPKSIDVVLVDASLNPRGRFIFRTEDGQLWRQTDTNDPRFHGFPVTARIRKGLMGTYFIKVKGVAGAVRVRRIN